MSADLFEPDDFQLTHAPAKQTRALPQAGAQRRGHTEVAPEQQSTDEWLRDYDAGASTSEEQYELAMRFAAAPLAAEGHPYAQRKGICVQHEGSPIPLRQSNGELLLPLQDTVGAIQGVQRILPDGNKQQWKGSMMTGHFHLIGAPLEKAQDIILVAEGFATGASAYEATALPVAVSCGAGNLCEAAKAIRDARPSLSIVVLADDDWHGDAALAGKAAKGNAGMLAARSATLAVRGKLAVPVFPAGYERREDETDFNDLAQLPDGAALVLQCIKAAQPVTAAAESVTSASGSGGEAWEEPQPLPDKLLPVEPFHEAMLPASLRGWVMDTAERADCPPDFTAAGAVSALSSLLSGRLHVQPKLHDDFSIAPNFWTVAIGEPGVQKSFCMGEAMAMLKRLKRGERARCIDARLLWEAQAKRASLAVKEAEKQAEKLVKEGDKAGADALIADALREEQALKNMEPRERGYIYTDLTVQAHQEAMLTDPWGGMLYRDELVGVLKSFEMQGQEQARGFYLQAWGGEWEYDMRRIVRGERFIPYAVTTLAGTTQPSVWLPYVRQASRGGDGLVQRFLPIWPDRAPVRLIDRKHNEAARQQALRLFEYFASLPAPEVVMQPDGSMAYEVPKRRVTPAAREVYKDWLRPMKEGVPALNAEWGEGYGGHVSKMQTTLPTLALICALTRSFEQGQPLAGSAVDEVDMRRALAWEPYLLSHMRRTYAAAGTPDMDAARKLLSMIQAAKLTAPNSSAPLASFGASDVARKEWSGLKKADEVYRAADVLAVYGWLHREEGQRGGSGRPREPRYWVHPCLPGGAR